MKTINKSLMSFILVFVMIFSSLSGFAQDTARTPKDFSLIIGDFEYFSNSENEYRLSRVRLENGIRIGKGVPIFKTGSVILAFNENDDFFYCYFTGDDAYDSGIYRLTKSGQTLKPILILETQIISELILTKDKNKNDVIYFVTSDSKQLNKLTFETIGNPNEAILTETFKYNTHNEPSELKVTGVDSIYAKESFLYFNQLNEGVNKTQKLHLDENEVSDIAIESFEVEKQIDGAITEPLSLYPGEEISLITTDILPQNPTNIGFNWEFKPGIEGSEQPPITLTHKDGDSTEATLKIPSSAIVGTSTTLKVSDKFNIKDDAAKVNITINIKANPTKNIELDDNIGIDSEINLEKTKSIKIPLKLIGENENYTVTDIQDAFDKITILPESNDYVSIEKILDKENNEIYIEIKGNEITDEGQPVEATIKFQDNDIVGPLSINVTELKNPITKIKFDTTQFKNNVTLEKSRSIDIPLILTRKYPELETTDTSEEIKNVIVASTEDDYIAVSVVEGEDENSGQFSVRITGKKVTPTTPTKVTTVSTVNVEGMSVEESGDTSPKITVIPQKNPLIKVEFDYKGSDTITIKEKEIKSIPLKLTFRDGDIMRPDRLDEIKRLVIDPKFDKYIDSSIVTDKDNKEVWLVIKGKQSTPDKFPANISITIRDMENSKIDSPNIMVTALDNPTKIVKFDKSGLKDILSLQKGESITIPVKLIGEHTDVAVTDKESVMDKIITGVTKSDYISVEKILENGNISIKITAKEVTPDASSVKATINLDKISIEESGDTSPPIIVTQKINPIAKAEFDTTAPLMNIEKDSSIKIPLKLIGKDSSSDITDTIAEIQNLINVSVDSKYIKAKLIVDEKTKKLFVEITGQEVTPEGSASKVTTVIGNDEKSKSTSPIITVREIVKPSIVIKPVSSKDNQDTDVAKPFEIVNGKSRGYKVFIEINGKLEDFDEVESKNITWSVDNNKDNEVITIDPKQGGQTKVTAVSEGSSSLVATYKYEGEKTVEYKANITVITDEYGDYDKWPDKEIPSYVSPTKKWTIKFSQPLDESTINSRNIYVKKRISSKDDVLYDDTRTYLGDDDKTLIIEPTRPYPPGDYFLYIESRDDAKGKNRSIKNIYGTSLNSSIKMKFTVR